MDYLGRKKEGESSKFSRNNREMYLKILTGFTCSNLDAKGEPGKIQKLREKLKSQRRSSRELSYEN